MAGQVSSEDIQLAEYQVTWQETTVLTDVVAAYQAPNRAHGLRTYFTPGGLRVVARSAIVPTWQLGLRLAGYGYAGDMRPVSAATLNARGNGIAYVRDALVEWYVNDERGVEQGFTLTSAPAGTVSDTVAV